MSMGVGGRRQTLNDYFAFDVCVCACMSYKRADMQFSLDVIQGYHSVTR